MLVWGWGLLVQLGLLGWAGAVDLDQAHGLGLHNRLLLNIICLCVCLLCWSGGRLVRG